MSPPFCPCADGRPRWARNTPFADGDGVAGGGSAGEAHLVREPRESRSSVSRGAWRASVLRKIGAQENRRVDRSPHGGIKGARWTADGVVSGAPLPISPRARPVERATDELTIEVID